MAFACSISCLRPLWLAQLIARFFVFENEMPESSFECLKWARGVLITFHMELSKLHYVVIAKFLLKLELSLNTCFVLRTMLVQPFIHIGHHAIHITGQSFSQFWAIFYDNFFIVELSARLTAKEI